MAIRTKNKTVVGMSDPLSMSAQMVTLGGNTVQTYDSKKQEYTPDRSKIPLILLPTVSVTDPSGKMNGKVALTGVEWFEGAPAADKGNKIMSTTDGYVIGDGTVTGFPNLALKVTKNIPVDSPSEIYAIAHFTDTRTGADAAVPVSVKIYTTSYSGKDYSLRMVNVPGVFTVNPMDMVADTSGAWPYTVKSQMYTGEDALPDTNAAYWWKVRDSTSGNWREFDETELAVLVLSGRNSDGTWAKDIKLDLRFVRDLDLQVTACYYTGTKPTKPTSVTLTATTGVRMRMPHQITTDVQCYKGGKVDADLSTTVGYECVVRDGDEVFSGDKLKFFSFKCYAQSLKAGSEAKLVSTGQQRTEFAPKALGFDSGYGVNVYFDVGVYDVYKPVVSGGKVVITGGKAVVVPTYL